MQVLQSQNYPMLMDHIVFLDGSSSNFKCGGSLFYVSCFPSLIKCKKFPFGTCMQWNYFVGGHGKGRWVRIGTSIK
jgi:hypothetical protein